MAGRTITVHAPNPAHTGVTAGVAFVRGKAEVDANNVQALQFFRRHGYGIDKPVEAAAEPKESQAGGGAGGEEKAAGGPPPKVGKGSSAKAWAEYAQGLGLEVEGLSRAEIIKAVEEYLDSDGGESDAAGEGESEA